MAEIVDEAVQRDVPYWNTGVMAYDFESDEGEQFEYSLEVIAAFSPSPSPTTSTSAPSNGRFPSVKEAEDERFDLLNMRSYGWAEWFFAVMMVLVLGE